MKYAQIVSDIICNTLLDPDVLQRARRRKGAFTRNCGKLPFWAVMKLLISNVKRTISAVLDEFFSNLAKASGIPLEETRQCSQQAFSKARAGIDHTIFKECFDRVIRFLCGPASHKYLHRLACGWDIIPIGIDGSKIPLPNRKNLLDGYGGMGQDASSPTAIASIAYDSLNDIILDAQFEPLSVDERTLAKRHMLSIKSGCLTDLGHAMFVFDRGYASADMFEFIQDKVGARFLFRLRANFNKRIDAIPEPGDPEAIVDERVTLDTGFKLRVIKLALSSGIVETLVTNDFTQDKELFRRLYFLRWPCEEEYKLVKQKIGLTSFRGYSENSILQEFWISMLMANLTGVFRKEADGVIKQEQLSKPGNRHSYKCNNNELIGCISRHFQEYMDAETSAEKMSVIRYILKFAISHKVVDKKGTGESSPRPKPRDCKNHYNVKNTH